MKVKFSFGRSMLEMLGVLAIIGILSLGGLAAYRMGMDRYKANQTMDDIVRRATLVPTQDEDYRLRDETHEYCFLGLKTAKKSTCAGTKGRFYEMYTTGSDSTEFEYQIKILDVENSVCRRMLSMQYKGIAGIKIGNQRYDFNPKNVKNFCKSIEDTNTMVFYFDCHQ